MSLIGRIMAAYDAFVHYDERNHIARLDKHFDTFEARCARSAFFTACYDNTLYSRINTFVEMLKLRHRLYKNIRGIYNPVYELIELIASNVFGGILDTETFARGAIPIQTDNPAILPALANAYKWSRWGEHKLDYVRLGANLGDVVLYIADDREKRRVRLEVLHPLKLYDYVADEVGNIKQAIIQYERSDEELRVVNGRVEYPKDVYTYTLVITKERFETYKNGYSFAFHTNALGEAVARWDNEYGFVPVVKVSYQELPGFKWGANSYFAALTQIHEINDQASLLNDQIRKVVIPLLFAEGVTTDTQIQKAKASERDEFTILYGPEGSSLTPVQAQIDITAALSNIQQMIKSGLERKLPELSWIRIREEGGNHTAPGVRAATSDAINRILAARGQFEAGLVRANQMMLTIGGIGKYDGFEPFNIDSYERGDLDHQIKERPVVPDTLSAKEKTDALNQASAPLWLILQELGFSEDVINEVRAEQEERARSDVRAAMESIFGSEEDDEQSDDQAQMTEQEEDENVETQVA